MHVCQICVLFCSCGGGGHQRSPHGAIVNYAWHLVHGCSIPTIFVGTILLSITKKQCGMRDALEGLRVLKVEIAQCHAAVPLNICIK